MRSRSSSAQAPARFRASLKQLLLKLPEAPIGTHPSQNPPPTFLSGCGASLPPQEWGLGKVQEIGRESLWVKALCHYKECGHFPVGMENHGVFLSRVRYELICILKSSPCLRHLASPLGFCSLLDGWPGAQTQAGCVGGVSPPLVVKLRIHSESL